MIAYTSLRSQSNPIIKNGPDADLFFVHSISNGDSWSLGEFVNNDGLTDDTMQCALLDAPCMVSDA